MGEGGGGQGAAGFLAPGKNRGGGGWSVGVEGEGAGEREAFLLWPLVTLCAFVTMFKQQACRTRYLLCRKVHSAFHSGQSGLPEVLSLALLDVDYMIWDLICPETAPSLF